MLWPQNGKNDHERLQTPRKKPRLTFAGWRGHHVGVRVKDLNEAKNWYVEKLDFRVVHEMALCRRATRLHRTPNDDAFLSNCWVAASSADRRSGYSGLGDSLRYARLSPLMHLTCRISRGRRRSQNPRCQDRDRAVPVDAISRKLAFFADPSGNLIELAEIVT